MLDFMENLEENFKLRPKCLLWNAEELEKKYLNSSYFSFLVVCSAGTEAKRDNGGSFVCRGCEKGFYKETEGVELCTQCNENFTTANTGAMRSSDCDIRKKNLFVSHLVVFIRFLFQIKGLFKRNVFCPYLLFLVLDCT